VITILPPLGHRRAHLECSVLRGHAKRLPPQVASFIGLYQVNVVIPAGITAGDSVPVVLAEGSQVSQPATISVR
jgi:hypothetical protein